MEGQSGAKRKSIKNKQKSRHKKLFNFLLSLFGRKTKKSFLSVITHLVESYEREKLISFEEKKMIKNMLLLVKRRVQI